MSKTNPSVTKAEADANVYRKFDEKAKQYLWLDRDSDHHRLMLSERVVEKMGMEALVARIQGLKR